MKSITRLCNGIALCLLLVLTAPSSASTGFTLGDYASAAQAGDMPRLRLLQSYILGAVETHLFYSRMLSDWTNVNLLCSGNGDLDMDELGKMFEGKILALRRRHGDDIMGMPITGAVQMMVEEDFRCYR